ncbi:MAG: nicotinate-nucleotide adenylyltransferase [Hyphomicrobiales bacterium]|nr:nicotinate-nucleotide adenylyltransferase [Hyphomicrobiales bacterium]
MRIGLLGGSFDPPHDGHRQVSLVGLHAMGLDQVWWLVSPQNPLKTNAPSLDLADRIAAARRLANHPRIRATAIEATLGTTFTAEMLRKLSQRLRNLDLVWMMGADNLATFHHWRDWRKIAATVPIAVFNRPGMALTALSSPAAKTLTHGRLPAHEAALLPAKKPPAWVFLPVPNVPLSSTAIRAATASS